MVGGKVRGASRVGGRPGGGEARVDHRGTVSPPAVRIRSRSDGAGRVERDRDDDGGGGGSGSGRGRDVRPRAVARSPDRRDRVAHRGHIRQRVGAVHPAPDPVQQQPETRVHVALSGHQRLHRAGRHAGPHVHPRLLPRHVQGHVDMPDPRPLAVLRAGLRLRGRRHGRRTVAGAHQTVFLPKGTLRSRFYFYYYYSTLHPVDRSGHPPRTSL